MIGLEKVTGRILSEAEKDANAVIAEAEKKCAEIGARSRDRIAAINDRAQEEISSEGQNIVSRAKSASSMQTRNIMLSAKGEALDLAFDAAVEAICGMPRGDYAAFLCRLASEAVDANRGASSCRISMNAADASSVGEAVLSALRSSHGGVTFSLSDVPAGIRGGLLLDFGDTDVDCSVETVVAQNRPALEGRVCTILFDRSAK
jgi:V/A-type H+-transporting ATPase subunit E